jgi:hypothetical protein
MSDDAGRIWHTGNTDDAGRIMGADADADAAALVVTIPCLPDTAFVDPSQGAC